ncbi:MAG: hypothetical protein BWY73_01663 [candidate division TA06 bacterium ADurb.Bin417]|uniref:Uncharacterized protein n=1 Tax=candidate division TA06 bacterium ADurb.Bin417 TaxID=1852828 RepID=A0A1V5M5K5_UNCT6|nr:MAG: hypothetical protein BWY73_01663 [candidate division TA06 bacterium ADurb.Bin417]
MLRVVLPGPRAVATFYGYSMSTGYTTYGPVRYYADWNNSAPGGDPSVSIKGPGE